MALLKIFPTRWSDRSNSKTSLKSHSATNLSAKQKNEDHNGSTSLPDFTRVNASRRRPENASPDPLGRRKAKSYCGGSQEPVSMGDSKIRVVLFRECDTRGRKLLFDSKTVHRISLDVLKGPNALNNRRIVEAHGNYGYEYKPAHSDVETLGEMVFGSASLNFQGDCLKIHELSSNSHCQIEEALMVSKVFVAPWSVQLQSPNSSTSSCFASSSNTSLSSVKEQRITLARSEKGSGTLQKTKTLLKLQSEDDSGYTGDATNTSDGSLASLRTMPSSCNLANSSSHRLHGSLANVKSSTSWNTLPKNYLSSPYSPGNSKKAASDSLLANDRVASTKELGGGGGRGGSSCTSLSNRKPRLGLAVILSLREDFADLKKQFFRLPHVLECMLQRLQADVENAYLNRRKFAHFMTEAMDNFLQNMNTFIRSPLLDSMWLSMASAHKDEKRKLATQFLEDFADLFVKTDTKFTSFFFSTLLTAVLSHHIAWVSTIGPVEPENLFFKRASSKSKSSSFLGVRTVIRGENSSLVLKLLRVLSYFIRNNVWLRDHFVESGETSRSALQKPCHNYASSFAHEEWIVIDSPNPSRKSSLNGAKENVDPAPSFTVTPPDSKVAFRLGNEAEKCEKLLKSSPRQIVQQKNNFLSKSHSVEEFVSREPQQQQSGAPSANTDPEASYSPLPCWRSSSDPYVKKRNRRLSEPVDERFRYLRDYRSLRFNFERQCRALGVINCHEGKSVDDRAKLVGARGFFDQYEDKNKRKRSKSVSKGSTPVLLEEEEEAVAEFANKLKEARFDSKDRSVFVVGSVPEAILALRLRSSSKTEILKPSLSSRLLEVPLVRSQQPAEESDSLHRLIGAVSPTYVPDRILQGVVPTICPNLEELIVHDLRALKACDDTKEPVCILADTDTWDIKLVSCGTHADGYIGMSPSVASLIESTYYLWKAGASPVICLQRIEASLKSLYLQSLRVAQFLLQLESPPLCSMEKLTSSLRIDLNDVPLILAAAALHTPCLTEMYGISVR